MYAPSSEARNSAVLAMSSTDPIRPSGVCCRTASISNRCLKISSVIGVSIRWAAMQLTRTLSGPYSIAAIWLAYSRPFFDAA